MWCLVSMVEVRVGRRRGGDKGTRKRGRRERVSEGWSCGEKEGTDRGDAFDRDMKSGRKGMDAVMWLW